MRILVIENDSRAPAGIVGERMAARGLTADVVRPHDGDSLPDHPDGYAGAVILGGTMAADDDAGFPVFRPMVNLLQRFHAEERPLLGICLGSQLLARSFGGMVRRFEGGLELGYVPISLTEAGASDPLLAGTGPAQRIMQWHQDTFDLPRDAVHLMEGAACRAQAFRFGRSAYAFQCHFEAHPGIVDGWLAAYAGTLPRHYGETAPSHVERVRRETAEHAAAQRRFAETVSDRWLDLVQGS